MRLKLAQVFGLASIVLLAGYGGFAWTRQVDSEAGDRYSEELRRVAALDASLTREVMEVRSGVTFHYDNIVQTQAALRRALARLRHPPEFLGTPAVNELRSSAQACEDARKRAETVLDRFKSEHAILRNSLRYLPMLAADIDSYVPSTRDEQELKNDIDQLVRDVLLLHAWLDEQTLERVARSLDQLADSSMSNEALPTELIVRHAKIVRDKNVSVSKLLREAALVPRTERIKALASQYEGHYLASLERSALDRTVVFLLTLVLIVSGAAYVILRLKRSADALERSRAQLQEANRSLEVEKEKQKELAELKSRFVSMTSHEFRTPLSRIVSSVEMLEAYETVWSPEKRSEHFGRIRAAALEMATMLDRILLIGRTDAGMLQFKEAPVELEALCRSVVESAEQSTNCKNRIALSTGQMPEDVMADEYLLRQILENLLSNAIKYSPDGSPVAFSVHRTDSEIVFAVRDEGIGIPEEDRKHLMETFHRGSNVGKIAGSGLGLAIVKRAVDLHHGTLEIHSERGAGTQFLVRVPYSRKAA